MAHVAHVVYAWRTSATPLGTFGEPKAYSKILGRMWRIYHVFFFSYTVLAQ